MDFMKLDNEIVADTLIALDFEIFQKIKVNELNNVNWTKNDKFTLAPNIIGITQRFNKVSSWIAYEILRYNTAKERKEVLEKFIEIANVKNIFL